MSLLLYSVEFFKLRQASSSNEILFQIYLLTAHPYLQIVVQCHQPYLQTVVQCHHPYLQIVVQCHHPYLQCDTHSSDSGPFEGLLAEFKLQGSEFKFQITAI